MQSEAFEPFPGGLLLLFRYEPEAYSRRYDPNLIAGLELRRDQGPSILICGPQNRQHFSGSLTVLARDGFEVLLRHPDLAEASG